MKEFILRNDLPAAFSESATHYFLPFAEWLERQVTAYHGGTYVLGINGAQGTGKSTLAQLIKEYLATEFGRKAVVLSIDDIYLTREERQALGRGVHPLLSTRGVPGTHDVALGLAVIKGLRSLQQGETFRVPRFDKSRDDRCPPSDWATVTGAVDVVIFEGWCVASKAMTDAELKDPVNALESSADADGRWRSYVNDRLRSDYAQLFACLDSLLFLQAPDFDAVYRWRLEQEHKLRQRADSIGNTIMSDDEVKEFICLYERITRNNIAVLPAVASAVIKFDKEHRAISLSYRRGA